MIIDIFQVKEGAIIGSMRDLLKYPKTEEVAKLQAGSDNQRHFTYDMVGWL